MQLRAYFFRFMLPALLLTGFSPSVQAVTQSWKNTGGTDFNAGSSWVSGTAPSTGDVAIFSAAAVSQPNLSSALSLAQIRFTPAAATGYDLTSNSGNTVALTLTGTGVSTAAAIQSTNTSGTNIIDAALILGGTIGGTQTFVVGNGGQLLINGVISGGDSSSTLSLNSSSSTGLIKLTGSNSFTSNIELIGTNTAISVGSIGNAGASSNLGAGTTIKFTNVGSLKYTGAGESASKVISLNNTTGATIDTSAATGALVLTGSLTAPAAGAKTLTLIGGATSSEFQGRIGDGSGGGTTAIVLNGGTWILSGSNNFSGGVSISSGTLGIKNASALGSGTFSPSLGTIDNLTGGALTLSTNNAITMASTTGLTFIGTNDLNMGTGAVTLSPAAGTTITVSAGTLTFGGAIGESAAGKTLIKAGAGTLVLNGNNTFTGLLTANSGTLTLAGDNSSATGGVKLGNAAATLNLNNAKALGVSGTFNIAAAGTIDNTSGSAVSLTTNNAITLANSFTFIGSNDLNLGTGAVTLTTGKIVTVSASTLTIGGTFSAGTQTFTKDGAGRLILTGANANTGAVTINAGALQAVDGTGINAGSILQLRGGVFQSSGTFSRNVNTSAGGVNWSTSSGGFAANGASLVLQLNGGTGSLTWNGSSFVQTGQALIFGSTTADNVVDFQNAINLGSSGTNTRTITVLDNTNSTADRAKISGAITTTSGSQSLLKDGAGVLELTGSNTYGGSTTVSAGTLLINGNQGSATGAVSVSSGAILGGSGTIGGAVTVSGTLSPGNSPGNLTVTNSVTIADGGALTMEISGSTAGTSYDRVTMTGSSSVFSLSGTNNLVLALGFTPAINTLFFLVDNQGNSAISGIFEQLNGVVTNLAQGATFTVSSQQFKISYVGDVAGGTFTGGNDLALQAIPEPATWALVAGAGTAFMVMRRRRR